MSSCYEASIKRNFKSDEELRYILEFYFGIVYDEKTKEVKVKKTAQTHNMQTKISYIKELDLFRISYNVPNVGRQYFDFQGNVFLDAYDEAKYRHFKATDEYAYFDEIFFGNYYTKANRIVTLIFALYCINPTVLRKCTRQDKKRRRTLVLDVKKGFAEKVYGVERKKTVKTGKTEKNEKADTEKTKQRNVKLTEEDRLQCELCCIEAVQLAAKFHDLNYFNKFLIATAKLEGIPYPNQTYQKKCFENFKKAVDKSKNK